MTDQPQEPRLSEQMWAVVVRARTGRLHKPLWRVVPSSMAITKEFAVAFFDRRTDDAEYQYLAMNERGDALAVPVTVSVDPGQLKEKSDG